MKHFISVLAFLLGAQAFAQVIQNRGLELWTVDSTECPTGYECTNDQTFGSGFEPVTKSTASLSGNYALSLETHIVAADTFFGYILKGDIDNQTGGIAYSNRPDSVSGYAHYDIKAGDTALIVAVFRRAGVPIGSCFGTFVGTQTNFAWFSFAIDWQTPPSILPDSMIFAAASSNALNEIGIAHGSKLVLDNVRFVGSGAVAQPANNDFENWTTIKSEKPVDWSTFLDYPFAYKYSLVNRLTDRSKINSGSSAIEIKTDIIDGDTLLGYLNNYNDNNPGGYAYTKQIDTLTGYYRFQTPGIDSGTAMITLHSGMQEYHKGVRLPPVSTYTEFNLPFNCHFKPDSIRISFIAGTEFNHSSIVKGSTLWLDDLDFRICDAPKLEGAVTGDTVLCIYSDTIKMGIAKNSGIEKYNWNLPSGYAIISAPTDSNFITVALDSTANKEATVQVAGEYYCGTGIYTTKTLTVDSGPAKPSIVLNAKGDSLLSKEVGTSYRWWMFTGLGGFEGEPYYADSTKFFYQPCFSRSPESYAIYVQISNGRCFSELSEPFTTICGSIYENHNEAFKLFPNPTSSKVNIELENEEIDFDVKLFSNTGQLMYEGKNVKEVDLSGLNSGLYSLQVSIDSERYTKRIVKQ